MDLIVGNRVSLTNLAELSRKTIKLGPLESKDDTINDIINKVKHN